jgi:hypothetical protein
MKYLKLIYDGSEDKLVTGYWCVEVYARLRNKQILPLIMNTFGVDYPQARSINYRTIKAIKTVNAAFDANGIWVADRGFDRLNLLETWISLNSSFVVRQRGDRSVVMPSGVKIIVADPVEHIRQQRAAAGLNSRIVSCKVRLPDNPKQVFVVASWMPGRDKPLILLTNMVVETIEQAEQIIGYYKKRWACEEASRCFT